MTPEWHRGWEIVFNEDTAYFTGEGYEAYQHGIDLDARRLCAATRDELITAIEEAEDEE